MGWIKNVEYGGSWLALENGFYAAEGIEPTYLQGGPNAPASPVAIAAGDAQIGVSASMMALLDAINEGNDFVVFGTQYQVSPGAVLSMADKPGRRRRRTSSGSRSSARRVSTCRSMPCSRSPGCPRTTSSSSPGSRPTR